MGRYRRVLLKVSGGALSGGLKTGFDGAALTSIAQQIPPSVQDGLQLAMVVGGGNFIRGDRLSVEGIDRVTGDAMGMLATIINGLAIQSVMESLGVETRLMTAIDVRDVAEPFIRRRAIRHLEKGRVIILVGGTGHPYFSTDTTAALRATQLGADVMMKGSDVDGVYDADPKETPGARLLRRVTYGRFINDRLKALDATAVTLCRDHNMPIIVFNMMKDGSIERVLRGEDDGTRIEG